MEIRSVPEAKQESWWGNHREKLRDFYTKYLDVEGIGIMGSDHVSDNAFYRAKEIVLKLTSKNLKFRTDLSGMRFSSFTVRVRLYLYRHTFVHL